MSITFADDPDTGFFIDNRPPGGWEPKRGDVVWWLGERSVVTGHYGGSYWVLDGHRVACYDEMEPTGETA